MHTRIQTHIYFYQDKNIDISVWDLVHSFVYSRFGGLHKAKEKVGTKKNAETQLVGNAPQKKTEIQVVYYNRKSFM